MKEELSHRNCYCEIADRGSDFRQKHNIPAGYCGICVLCGEPGHSRHYPGPVPATLAWCDPCYKVQAHKGPIRQLGAWHFDSATGKDVHLDWPFEHEWQPVREMFESLRTPKSALIIEVPGEIGLDLYVRLNGLIEAEYADRGHGFFARATIGHDDAWIALQAVRKEQSFVKALKARGVDLEIFQDGESD